MLFRCSQLGKLMTNSRSKSEVLGATAKAVIEEQFLWDTYGIKKEFWSKFTDKGIEMEDEAIQFAADVLGWGLVYKNTERFNNEWITGEPDVLFDDLLADIKCSWDGSTFPFFAKDIPNKDYYYQLQGYMWLTDKQESELVYCLMDTPLEIVRDEIRRAHWKANLIDDDDTLIEAVESQHSFSHIPKEKRVKRFIIQRDEKAIEQIKERVEVAREYYEQLKTEL